MRTIRYYSINSTNVLTHCLKLVCKQSPVLITLIDTVVPIHVYISFDVLNNIMVYMHSSKKALYIYSLTCHPSPFLRPNRKLN